MTLSAAGGVGPSATKGAKRGQPFFPCPFIFMGIPVKRPGSLLQLKQKSKAPEGA